MKKLVAIVIFTLTSFFVAAQDSENSNISTDTDSTSGINNTQTGSDNTSAGMNKYFFATNSGILETPVGFRIGVLERMGGYIATRFGKGYKYEEDGRGNVESSEATLFSASAGLIFPVAVKRTFKVHTFFGIGYGKWFDRPSQNGQTMGIELEGGLMLSDQKFMLNLGGVMLTGDGKSPKGDMTVGVGFRF